MAAKFTPRLIELIYEATLKSFWRKNALRKFLRASRISESFLSRWANDESKRDFLDRLFTKLQKTDNGKAVIYQMGVSLSEQTSFPDLQNWEDSKNKQIEAHRAVKELKAYLEKQSSDIESEKQRKAARELARHLREKTQRTITDRVKLQNELNELSCEIGTQAGGYKFEKWFYRMLDYCEITNRQPYKSNGRQVDGSLTLEGTTYLVELKFTDSQSSAPDIDSLKAKVDKMADNTMGIMVSISGYSKVAISEASGRRTTLIILDVSHLYLFLSGAMNFSDIVSRIRRHASQTGEAFLPVSQFSN